MSTVKVTVYVTSRNYGRFLEQCLGSVVTQTFRDWELIIFDEASSDDTLSIAQAFAARDPQRIRVVANEQPKGLRHCANVAIEMARGEYIIRLDGDDYFDENALLVLASYLNANMHIGLVYPNWTYISEIGDNLGVERRKRVGAESAVPDLPAHGACTMVRKRALKLIGGYDEQFDSQDGHELWMKLLARFGVGNVETPLFYYRQHDSSMSRDEGRLLASRRRIKRQVAANSTGSIRPRVAAVVPAKNTYPDQPNLLLSPLAGKPLIDHTLDSIAESGLFDVVIVTTDDEAVRAHCEQRGEVIAFHRPASQAHGEARLAEVVHEAVVHLENDRQVYPDVVAVLTPHTPLRQASHIQEALDTLFIYPVDRVISTYEDLELHFKHGMNGMEPLNPGMLNKLRYEREALFVANNAVHVLWRDALTLESMHHGRIGHIVMSREDGLNVKSRIERGLAEVVLAAKGR